MFCVSKKRVNLVLNSISRHSYITLSWNVTFSSTLLRPIHLNENGDSVKSITLKIFKIKILYNTQLKASHYNNSTPTLPNLSCCNTGKYCDIWLYKKASFINLTWDSAGYVLKAFSFSGSNFLVKKIIWIILNI